MSMTDVQFNDLRNIANLAYGSGVFEKTKGGNGHMGLIRGPNGEPRVFKCLTHRSERSAFANDEMELGKSQLECSSRELKLELKRLAVAAGMSERAVETMFDNVPANGLLTRKIVAQVVTDIGKASNRNVWEGLTGTGTVTDTSLSLKEDVLDINRYGEKGSLKLEEAVLAHRDYPVATTCGAAAQQFAAGHVGDEWTAPLWNAVTFLGNALPRSSKNFMEPVSYGLLIAKPEGVPLARPTFISLGDGVSEGVLRPRLLQLELTRLLEEHGDAEITPELRKKIARKALTAAVAEAWVIKTMFDIAKKKGVLRGVDVPALLDKVALDEDGNLREEVVNMARDGVRKSMEEQCERKTGTYAGCYLKHLYLDDDSLDIMNNLVFDPSDGKAGAESVNLSRMGLNNALVQTWSALTAEMKEIHAQNNSGFEGDYSIWSVKESKDLVNTTGGVCINDFWMEE